MDMFTVFLFGPWASFNCAKVVVRYVDENEISFNILEVQVLGCKHVSMSLRIPIMYMALLPGFLSLMKG
jgi:hypothetical protein